MFKLSLEKGRGTRDQIANIRLIKEKAREFHKNICFIDYAKAFVWITTNSGKIFKRWEYQTTLPASWEICIQVKKRQLEPDIGQQTVETGKGICQGCTLSPCLFNLYAEYIIQNARLDEAQSGLKTSRRNINSLRYADDTTLVAESEEKLKSPLMKVKGESEKVGLKLNIQKHVYLWWIHFDIWQN